MKALGAVAAAALLVAAIVVLREATQSVHEPIDPNSQLEVVFRISANRSEVGQTLAEMAEAQVLACRLEVGSDPIGPVEPLGEQRFRTVIAPALDTTDRRQFRGCLEDWVIDHVRIYVEQMNTFESAA